MTGALRLADWLTDPARPADAVHAYNATGPIPFRGMCGEGHWTVKATRAEAGPLCPVCREIVLDAASRTTSEVENLEENALVSEGELREMWGGR